MSNRFARFDDGVELSETPWDRARLDGDDELADRLEAEANRALATRLGWMPVHHLVYRDEDYPAIASEVEPQERRY